RSGDCALGTHRCATRSARGVPTRSLRYKDKEKLSMLQKGRVRWLALTLLALSLIASAAFSMLAYHWMFNAHAAGNVATKQSPGLANPQATSSSDWPMFLGNNARTGYNSAETIINATTASQLKPLWKHTVTKPINSQVVEANGMLYWGSWDGIEHASRL